MRRPEQTLHFAVAAYLTTVLDPSKSFWTTIGHGGGGRVRGSMLKHMGMKAGVADVLICWPHCVLWIELKAPRGKISPEQVAFGQRVGSLGHLYHICRSLDEVAAVLEHHAPPMRGRIAA